MNNYLFLPPTISHIICAGEAVEKGKSLRAAAAAAAAGEEKI
jgi:hypothetical protein